VSRQFVCNQACVETDAFIAQVYSVIVEQLWPVDADGVPICESCIRVAAHSIGDDFVIWALPRTRELDIDEKN